MATNYPGGIDEFYEPSQPSVTSLSQVGNQPGTETNPGRNHVEHHRDLGDAVTALQENAAQVGHDHSGDGTDTVRGIKLSAANTHQSVDTTSSGAIHHTLGTGATNAAAGNHTHDYNGGKILNRPFVACTSTTRPEAPFDGLMIYETDTNRVRVYADFGKGAGEAWNLLPVAEIPVVMLAQSSSQSITSAGTTVEWNQKIDDTFGYVTLSGGKATTITVSEPGVYQINCGIQWGVNFLPEVATVVVCKNGQETALRQSEYQTPSLISILGSLIGSDYSKTVSLAGKLRLDAGDYLTVKCRYSGNTDAGTLINTFFDADSTVKSRLEMHYVSP